MKTTEYQLLFTRIGADITDGVDTRHTGFEGF